MPKLIIGCVFCGVALIIFLLDGIAILFSKKTSEDACLGAFLLAMVMTLAGAGFLGLMSK